VFFPQIERQIKLGDKSATTVFVKGNRNIRTSWTEWLQGLLNLQNILKKVYGAGFCA